VQDVVGSDIVKGDAFFVLCIGGFQHTADSKLDNQTSDLPQELRHRHLLALTRGRGFAIDYRVTAKGFERWARGGPYEVGSADPGIPESVHLVSDLIAHLRQHRAGEARTGCCWTLATNQPN
jgi:hypothetical protein